MKTEQEKDAENLLGHYYEELKKILQDDLMSHDEFEKNYYNIMKEIDKLED